MPQWPITSQRRGFTGLRPMPPTRRSCAHGHLLAHKYAGTLAMFLWRVRQPRGIRREVERKRIRSYLLVLVEVPCLYAGNMDLRSHSPQARDKGKSASGAETTFSRQSQRLVIWFSKPPTHTHTHAHHIAKPESVRQGYDVPPVLIMH